jgi:hypothetical protein
LKGGHGSLSRRFVDNLIGPARPAIANIEEIISEIAIEFDPATVVEKRRSSGEVDWERHTVNFPEF